MTYAIRIKDELKVFEELDDLQSKVRQVRLVEKVGKQGFLYDTKQLFEPLTDTIKNTSEDKTKTITETSKKTTNNRDFKRKSFRINDW